MRCAQFDLKSRLSLGHNRAWRKQCHVMGNGVELQWRHRAQCQHKHVRQHQHVTKRRCTCQAGADDLPEAHEGASSSQKQIPIFPLSIVALPAAHTPLNIFEARYRVLFNTLLAGSSGTIEGLVDYNSPFAGSKTFGMCLAVKQGVAQLGTLLKIQAFHIEEDGRMVIDTIGTQRFRIINVVKSQPVLIAEVEILPDGKASDKDPWVVETADSVRESLRELLKLTAKVDAPAQLDQLDPTELSFWITSLFQSSIVEQQALLEMASTLSRLKALQQVLDENLKLLRAQKALKGVFEPEPETAEAAEVQQPSPETGATASGESDTAPGPAASGSAQPDMGQAGGEQQPDSSSSGGDMPSGPD